MPGSTERKMKSRIYQRRYRDTKKGSVLVKTHYAKQNKSMQNLFERKGVNTNKNFNKPLKPIQKRRLASFIRQVNKLKNSKSPTKEVKELENKRNELLEDFQVHLMMFLKAGFMSEKADGLLDKMEVISKEMEDITKQIEGK